MIGLSDHFLYPSFKYLKFEYKLGKYSHFKAGFCSDNRLVQEFLLQTNNLLSFSIGNHCNDFSIQILLSPELRLLFYKQNDFNLNGMYKNCNIK
jgi:hypothetical protein